MCIFFFFILQRASVVSCPCIPSVEVGKMWLCRVLGFALTHVSGLPGPAVLTPWWRMGHCWRPRPDQEGWAWTMKDLWPLRGSGLQMLDPTDVTLTPRRLWIPSCSFCPVSIGPPKPQSFCLSAFRADLCLQFYAADSHSQVKLLESHSSSRFITFWSIANN